MMMKVRYLGSYDRAFSVPCPSGKRYPCEPVTSLFIEVEDTDADWLLETQPELWVIAKEESPAPKKVKG